MPLAKYTVNFSVCLCGWYLVDSSAREHHCFVDTWVLMHTWRGEVSLDLAICFPFRLVFEAFLGTIRKGPACRKVDGLENSPAVLSLRTG